MPGAVGVWIGNNRLYLNPGKTEWLRVLEPFGSGTLPFLVLDGITLPSALSGSPFVEPIRKHFLDHSLVCHLYFPFYF